MTGLPRPLRPWAPHLALLQRDLAISLAPWIQRLAAAIGALAGTADPLAGDPDGYDGVIRRGPYERLLPTEWLFADAAPEEFDRRAAVGEHQFYRLATREPNATKRCLVLFDAGPSQLGTPRIAHLAALIVFAARCDAAKADLFWGTLQAGPARIQEGFSKARAEALLAARSALEGTPEQLHAWLTAPQLTSDDVWLVGAPTSPAAPKVNRLEVTDVLEPNTRRVDVALKRPARTTLRLQLDLPPANDCTRLLRAPFAEVLKPPPVIPQRVAGLGQLVFGIVANRLHMLGRDGELIVLPVPQGEAPWRTRTIIHRPAKGDRVVGVGWKTGAQAVVARHDAQGRIIQFAICPLTRRGELKRAPTLFKLDAPMEHGLKGGLRCASFQFDRVQLAFDDGLLTLLGDRAKFTPMTVLAHAATGNGVALLTLEDAGHAELSLASVGQRQPVRLEGNPPAAAFFGRGHRGFGNPSLPALAYARVPESREWTLESFSQRTPLIIPPDTRVAGVTGRHQSGLILLDATAKAVSLFTAKELKPLGQSAAPIVHVASDHGSDCVAWLDAEGRIGIANLYASGRFLKGEHVKNSARFLFTLEKVVTPA